MNVNKELILVNILANRDRPRSPPGKSDLFLFIKVNF